MMKEMKKFHRQLVRDGNFKAARLLLKFMFRRQVFISDGNDEAWSSGMADYLLINYKSSNRKSGFIAYLKAEKILTLIKKEVQL